MKAKFFVFAILVLASRALLHAADAPQASRPNVVTAPRWQAAWWRSNGFLGGFISALEHRATLASSVVT
jgi:hypothetical protein